MLRSYGLLCAALLVASSSIWYATPSGPRADLTYANPSGIHTLDPARMSWTQDFRVALNIWEGLTTWHPETIEPIAGSATFPPEISDDGLTVSFSIRTDARWSNGDPVTATDFVRGWRRGIEPGTAADYAFLATDHIAGAAEYVAWRQRAVMTLSTLNRLADGWGITAAQAKALLGDPELTELTAPLEIAGLRFPEESNEPEWEVVASSLSELPIDWAAIHEQVLINHATRLEQRFAMVGVKAIDELTLVVRLTDPCSYFLDMTAFPVFLPCHESIELLRERSGDVPLTSQGLVVYDPQWTKPDYHRNDYPGLITNGAYRLADWRFKRLARMVVNRFYRDAHSIGCRTVDMRVFSSIGASLMAYESGDVDFLTSMAVPYDHEIARLARSGERRDFHLCDVFATYFLNFNCVSETVGGRSNPFLDARVRRAFALAVDKESIVENVLKRGDRVASSFVPPDVVPGYDPPRGLSYDPQAARQLLVDAGHAGGDGLGPIQLVYTPGDERVVQALARMWANELGVRVELRSLESRTFADEKANHRLMVARGNWYADYNDPTTFLNCLVTGNGNNDSGYSNPRYDNLLAAANRERHSAERMRLLRRAETIIVEQDLPILPIFHYVEPIAIKPYVRGLHPNARLWFPFRHVTVDR